MGATLKKLHPLYSKTWKTSSMTLQSLMLCATPETVWLDNQWCVISHIEPLAGAGLPHICNKCAISLSKKEIIQELMKRHPAHKHVVESIIERCKREGYGITFSSQEIDDLLGLEQPAHCSREEREDYKFARKQGLDNIKRDLLYNYNLRFTGTKKTKKGHGGWCVRQC